MTPASQAVIRGTGSGLAIALPVAVGLVAARPDCGSGLYAAAFAIDLIAFAYAGYAVVAAQPGVALKWAPLAAVATYVIAAAVANAAAALGGGRTHCGDNPAISIVYAAVFSSAFGTLGGLAAARRVRTMESA